MSSSTKTIYEFGPFRIDMERYLLLRDDQSIALSPKVFETLLFLVQHTGQSIKKDEIINSIWPDTFVEESNLAQDIELVWLKVSPLYDPLRHDSRFKDLVLRVSSVLL
jgi:DNA-binding winged helix-turn-helix (wHTH) protein